MTFDEYPKMLYGADLVDQHVVNSPDEEAQAREDGWGDHPDVRSPPAPETPKPRKLK